MSSLFWVLVFAIAPGIFWMLYFYSKDKLEPEPRHLVIRTFIIGFLAAIPIAWIEIFIGGTSPLLSSVPVMVVIVAPIVEEYGKFLAVKLTIYNHSEFDEPMDGIIYAVAGALGFATIENIGYIYSAAQSGSDEFLFTAIARALLSVPGHALFSSMWGYAMGQAKHRQDPRRANILMHEGVWLAIGLHALFNLLAVSSSWIGLLGAAGLILVVVLGWKAVGKRVDHALSQSPHSDSSNFVDIDDDDDEPPRPNLRI
jgi:RsiW-degrading membrane proteinase PrsW (M82 family)